MFPYRRGIQFNLKPEHEVYRADVEWALSLLTPYGWTDQDRMDQRASEAREALERRGFGYMPKATHYEPNTPIRPWDYGPGNRHIWGVQIAIANGLVQDVGHAIGRVAYRIIPEAFILYERTYQFKE